MSKFEKEIEVRWADVDQNRHVRHSAYYDYGAFARIKFLESIGFGAKEMEKIGIGPILFKEECNFIREVKPTDTITVNVLRGPIQKGSAKWVLYHEIYNQDGVKCAHIKAQGAWMDLRERKISAPSDELADSFLQLEEGSDFVYAKS